MYKSCNSPIEDPGLLQDIAQVDVGVQEVGIEPDSLLEVMYGQPNLPLGVEHAAQVAPGDGEIRPRLYSFQVARLSRRSMLVSENSDNQTVASVHHLGTSL